MKKTKEQLIEHLTNRFSFNKEYLEKLDINQLNELYETKEKEELSLSKNPNKFFYIKSLPIPKEVQTKTSNKAGAIVFVAFILMLLLVGALFLTLALIRN